MNPPEGRGRVQQRLQNDPLLLLGWGLLQPRVKASGDGLCCLLPLVSGVRQPDHGAQPVADPPAVVGEEAEADSAAACASHWPVGIGCIGSLVGDRPLMRSICVPLELQEL